MIKKAFYLFAIFSMAFFATSCGDDDLFGFDEKSNEYIEKGITFDSNEGSVILTLTHLEDANLEIETVAGGGNTSWMIVATKGLSEIKTQIIIGAKANETTEERIGNVLIKVDGKEYIVTVTQKGK